MILNWKTGFHKSYKPGSTLVGQIKNGTRPVSVTLDFKDIIYLQEHPFYLRTIKGALRYALHEEWQT